VTTGSDADSSGGAKVAASSIDGEDELVNVTNHATSKVQPAHDTSKSVSTSR
jgi:ubiquitin carboxyl-terminal hydrolase 4/11/15